MGFGRRRDADIGVATAYRATRPDVDEAWRSDRYGASGPGTARLARRCRGLSPGLLSARPVGTFLSGVLLADMA